MKRRTMRVMVEFEPPSGADVPDIREFITDWLEGGGGNRHPSDPLFHSLQNVRVSKPITAWRNPARKKTSKIRAIR